MEELAQQFLSMRTDLEYFLMDVRRTQHGLVRLESLASWEQLAGKVIRELLVLEETMKELPEQSGEAADAGAPHGAD